MQEKRERIIRYAREVVKRHNYNINEENIRDLVNLVEFFGAEEFIPVVNVLTANWQEVIERLDKYTEADWEIPRKVAQTYKLDVNMVALLMEVLEGEDTSMQESQTRPRFTDDDLRHLRQRVAEQEKK